ncbi:DNA-binding MarR family transcriptional regulator [Acidovorax sp. 62]|uniref:MarR family winged helix-turn-helix transcriptional regulator n=1 Tax=Acidovorax sp. 62 TaxID=2035203 RepID=UPI000C180934|nr:MarR family transcriptional regulator [Acidovorax sp. 62]PIF90339.1 DNA-binding MarR family transcriptional regulator [Acidovorax sp. 62]
MPPTRPARPTDAVDDILAQWQRERPDLDVSPMGIIGRLNRCTALLMRKVEEVFAQFDLSAWEFDMLAALRRSGAPYTLAPTTLFSTLMVTSGTMTHRMQRLEGRGLVARLPNPSDARSSLVQLTSAGLDLIDRAVEAHVANEHRLLATLKAADLAALEHRLSLLLHTLEPDHEPAQSQDKLPSPTEAAGTK